MDQPFGVLFDDAFLLRVVPSLPRINRPLAWRGEIFYVGVFLRFTLCVATSSEHTVRPNPSRAQTPNRAEAMWLALNVCCTRSSPPGT